MNDTATQIDATKGNAAAQPAHIELRNIKHAAFASQETECFTATVYINGKKEGEASNEGHGGSNRYYPHGLYAKLQTIADQMPDLDISDFYKDGQKHTMRPDADTVIGDILNAELQKKQLKRLCSKKTLFRKAGETYKKGEYATVNRPFSTEIKAWILSKYPNATILNESL